MPISTLQQVKFKVGDTSLNYPFLDTATYEWLLEKNASNVIKASIEALEIIINQIALSPESVITDAVHEVRPSVEVLERRLEAMKSELTKSVLGKARFPILVHSDRKNWDDLDALYPK